ncbi:MAG: MerR family transcriptional regulator [Myxococcota bacterium]
MASKDQASPESMTSLPTEIPERQTDEDGARAVNGPMVSAADPGFESAQDPRIPADQKFFKVGEVARIIGVEPHVLRYWEQHLPQVRPQKTASGQRRYQRNDVAVLLTVRRLRYEEHLTIAATRRQIEISRGAQGGRALGPSRAALVAEARRLVEDLLSAAED